MKYSKHLRIEININEFEISLNDPTIIHNVLCWPKLWFSNFLKYKKERIYFSI